MVYPITRKSHQIDLYYWDATLGTPAYVLIGGLTSYDFGMTRPARKTLLRDKTAFAVPTREAEPGILDASFTGSGKLDIDFRQEMKVWMTTSTSMKFKLEIEDMGEFEANFVVTALNFTGDVADEEGYIEVSMSMEMDGPLTWTNDA